MASQQARFGGLARFAPTLIVLASAAFLFAALFASIAQVYLAGLILNIADKVEDLKGVSLSIASPADTGTLSPTEAAALLQRYAAAIGISALVASLSGIIILTVAVNARKGKYRGLQRFLTLWGILLALMAASLAMSRPIYSGSVMAVLLVVVGGLLVAASGAMPTRLGKYAAIAAVVGGLLVAGGVYMGAFPLKTSSADFSWLNDVDLGVKHNIGVKGLNAIVDPAFALKGKVTPRLESQVVNRLDYLAKLIEEGKATKDIVSGTLTDVANELRAIAKSLPDNLAAEALRLADRAESMANSNVGVDDVNALKSDAVKLVDKVSKVQLGTQGVATGLEAIALLHPVIIGVASILGAAAYFTGERRGLIVAVSVLVTSAYMALLSLNLLGGPVKLASDYINMLGMGSLEVRTYTTWKAAATASGLTGISLSVAFLASLLAILGSLLYLLSRLLSRRASM